MQVRLNILPISCSEGAVTQFSHFEVLSKLKAASQVGRVIDPHEFEPLPGMQTTDNACGEPGLRWID